MVRLWWNERMNPLGGCMGSGSGGGGGGGSGGGSGDSENNSTSSESITNPTTEQGAKSLAQKTNAGKSDLANPDVTDNGNVTINSIDGGANSKDNALNQLNAEINNNNKTINQMLAQRDKNLETNIALKAEENNKGQPSATKTETSKTDTTFNNTITPSKSIGPDFSSVNNTFSDVGSAMDAAYGAHNAANASISSPIDGGMSISGNGNRNAPTTSSGSSSPSASIASGGTNNSAPTETKGWQDWMHQAGGGNVGGGDNDDGVMGEVKGENKADQISDKAKKDAVKSNKGIQGITGGSGSSSGNNTKPSTSDSINLGKVDTDNANYNQDDWNRGMEQQSSSLVSDEQCKAFLKRAFREDPLVRIAYRKSWRK